MNETVELILVLFLWACYFALHSVLASNRVKASIKQVSMGFWRWYRIMYNLVSLAGFGGISWMHFNHNGLMLWESELWNMFIGGMFMVIGSIILFLSLLNYDLGEFTGFAKPEDRTTGLGELRVSGLNKIVRHPLYFGIIQIILGLFLFSPSLLNALFLILIFVYLMIGIRLEEKKLIEEFGEAYIEYRKTVKMLIPFIL